MSEENKYFPYPDNKKKAQKTILSCNTLCKKKMVLQNAQSKIDSFSSFDKA